MPTRKQRQLSHKRGQLFSLVKRARQANDEELKTSYMSRALKMVRDEPDLREDLKRALIRSSHGKARKVKTGFSINTKTKQGKKAAARVIERRGRNTEYTMHGLPMQGGSPGLGKRS